MLHLPGRTEKKRSVDDEMQALLDLMDKTRGDPWKLEEYKAYLDAYERLYKAKNERRSKFETFIGTLGQTAFMIGWGERHVFSQGFKMVFQRFGNK